MLVDTPPRSRNRSESPVRPLQRNRGTGPGSAGASGPATLPRDLDHVATSGRAINSDDPEWRVRSCVTGGRGVARRGARRLAHASARGCVRCTVNASSSVGGAGNCWSSTSVLTLVDVALTVTYDISHAPSDHRPAAPSTQLFSQVSPASGSRPIPTRLLAVTYTPQPPAISPTDDVPHRPVNHLYRRRRVSASGGARHVVAIAASQATGSSCTVCPSRSSCATRRRVWASSLRRESQSAPRSW